MGIYRGDTLAKNSRTLRNFFAKGRADAIAWTLIMILGAVTMGMTISGAGFIFSSWNGWAVFLAGFGVIVLAGVPFYIYFGMSGKAIWNLIIFLV